MTNSDDFRTRLILETDLFRIKTRLLVYVMKFAPPDNPILIDSCRKIAEYLCCTESSVAKQIKRLELEGILEKIQNGVWEVNYERIEQIKQKNKAAGRY